MVSPFFIAKAFPLTSAGIKQLQFGMCYSSVAVYICVSSSAHLRDDDGVTGLLCNHTAVRRLISSNMTSCLFQSGMVA